jgi:hypothetical protein
MTELDRYAQASTHLAAKGRLASNATNDFMSYEF